MKKILLLLAVAGLLLVVATGRLLRRDEEPTRLMSLHEQYQKKPASTVDHASFAVLRRAFRTPQEVTEACITCHNHRAQEVMRSNHWNWEREEYIAGRGIVYLGKKNALNNFCIGTRGNEKSCAKCHIGYGMDAQGRVFTDSTNIDCLVCHDNTDTYTKATEQGGRQRLPLTSTRSPRTSAGRRGPTAVCAISSAVAATT